RDRTHGVWRTCRRSSSSRILRARCLAAFRRHSGTLAQASVVSPLRVQSASDRDELVSLVGASLRLFEDVSDAADVHLVVDHARLEWSPLLREKRVRFPGRGHGVEEADDLEVVLGVALEELL